MTTPTHDTFVEMAAAYALDALDRDERQTFERHLETCPICQRELADLRRVTAGMGLAADPVTPPVGLKARTLANASAQSQGRRAPRKTFEWLMTAASLAVAVGAGMYAWSLRTQLDQMQQTMAELSDRANALRNNLDEARREGARLSRVVEIVQGPGTIQVNLSGTPAAQSAIGRAFFNAARGMVVSAERMPVLPVGRVYQLWVIVGSARPVGAGVFTVAADGAATVTATLPPNLVVPPGTPVTVAVTQEPAGGSENPTLPILIAGDMKAR